MSYLNVIMWMSFMRNRFAGFTLVELLITLLISGILASVAVPSFLRFLHSSQINSQANLLFSSLYFARSEAAKRGVNIIMRHRGDTDAVWDQGWKIFTDVDDNKRFNDDGDALLCESREDCLLHVQAGLADGITLRSNNPFKEYIIYRPTGSIKNEDTNSIRNGSFTLCSDDDLSIARKIIISRTGRPRMAEATACP